MRTVRKKATATIEGRVFAFNRRTHEPLSRSKTPLIGRESMVSKVVAAVFSPEERASNRKPTTSIGMREASVLKKEWGLGREAPRTLERAISTHLANPGRAEKMGLGYWMEDFKLFLDIHAIPGTPASKQRGRIIRAAERAILSFSSRCSSRAATVRLFPDETEITKLKEVSLFLKRLSGMLSESGDTTLHNDIDFIDRVTGVSKSTRTVQA